jgi:peptidoglycan-associated lipoprotein
MKERIPMTRISPRLAVVAALVVTIAVSSSCQNKAKPKSTSDVPQATAEPAPPPPQPAAPPPSAEPFPRADVDKSNALEGNIDELNRQGVLKTVYFAYNSDEIDAAAKAILQSNATWLATHGAYTVEVGGHCDERGSIGYNVALGDRRANSVKDYLSGLGVGGAKLVAVSYGEEKPADPGHSETAFAKNRRAEFTIKP